MRRRTRVEVDDVTIDELRSSAKAALTVTEVAALLGIDGRTVRRACEDGQLPALRVGRRLLIPRELLLPLLTPDMSDGSDATSEPIANIDRMEPGHGQSAFHTV